MVCPPIRQHRLRWLLLLAVALLVAACAQPTPPSPVAAPVANAPVEAVKILVDSDGMYEIDLAHLAAAGLPIENRENLDSLTAGDLRLLHRGHEQRFWLDRTGDGADGEPGKPVLRFYGQASQNRYSRENVYWLQTASTPPPEPLPPLAAADLVQPPSASDVLTTTPDLPPDVAFRTLWLSANEQYVPQVPAGEHWFWHVLRAPQSQDYPFQLAHPAPFTPTLAIDVWGSTTSPTAPDHRLLVRLNGQQVGDVTWEGRQRERLLLALPTNLLAPGENTLTLEAPGDTGALADIIYVDGLFLVYPRLLAAADGQIRFLGTGDEQKLTGFAPDTPVHIYPATPNAERHTAQATPSVAFTGSPGTPYIALAPGSYRQPLRLEPVQPTPDIRTLQAGADYLAIGPAPLLEALHSLLAWRESQGLTTLVLPWEAVSNQFGAGLPEPQAINRLLRFASQSWQTAPRFVLLVGDATYDPRGYRAAPEANQLPALMVETQHGGETASDVALADLDDDSLPDLAIGRMPARTPQQIATLVAKTLEYEQQERQQAAWERRILAVADGQEARFQHDAQRFLAVFTSPYETVLAAPQAGSETAGQQVRDSLAAGNGLVAYFGHGSLTQWGQDRMLASDDLARLSSDAPLPVMLHFTCLTGLFTHPQVESMAETLLWKADGGPVAVLAPTSLTLPTDQSFLVRNLAESLVAQPAAPLGSVLLEAWQQLPPTPGATEVMQTFLLFGDPALRLR